MRDIFLLFRRQHIIFFSILSWINNRTVVFVLIIASRVLFLLLHTSINIHFKNIFSKMLNIIKRTRISEVNLLSKNHILKIILKKKYIVFVCLMLMMMMVMNMRSMLMRNVSIWNGDPAGIMDRTRWRDIIQIFRMVIWSSVIHTTAKGLVPPKWEQFFAVRQSWQWWCFWQPRIRVFL